MNKKKNIIIVLAAVSSIILLYIMSYLPLRSGGGFKMVQSGETRYNTGLSVTDIIQWSPKDCWWQPDFKNIYGVY